MKTLYATFAVGALLTQVASAQINHTLSSNPAQEAMRLEKLHGHQGHYTPTGERGANDECAGAIVLTVGATCSPVNGDLSSATESQAAATCNTYTADAANDLWFSFTATTAYTTFEATGGPEIDPIVEVFSGDCGNLVSEGCADATLVEATETWTIPTAIGSVYYGRVYYWIYDPLPTDFSFTVCAYEGGAPPEPPVNDGCGSITPDNLSVPGTLNLSGTTLGATDAGDFAQALGLPPAVFHAFTLTECANVTVSYCNTDPAFEGWYQIVALGCPIDTNAIIFVTSSNLTDCPEGNPTLQYDGLEAGTYYIPVEQLDPGANGPYTLTVTSVSCIIGIDELTAADWSVFPNPGTGVFNLQYTGKNGMGSIEVMDVTGRVVYSERAQLATGTNHSMDLAGLSTGNYNVRLTVDGVRTEQRLMVK